VFSLASSVNLRVSTAYKKVDELIYVDLDLEMTITPTTPLQEKTNENHYIFSRMVECVLAVVKCVVHLFMLWLWLWLWLLVVSWCR